MSELMSPERLAELQTRHFADSSSWRINELLEALIAAHERIENVEDENASLRAGYPPCKYHYRCPFQVIEVVS